MIARPNRQNQNVRPLRPWQPAARGWHCCLLGREPTESDSTGREVLATATSDPTREPTAWRHSCGTCLRNASRRSVSLSFISSNAEITLTSSAYKKQSHVHFSLSLSPSRPPRNLKWLFGDPNELRKREKRQREVWVLVSASVFPSRRLPSLWVPRVLWGSCTGAIRGHQWKPPFTVIGPVNERGDLCTSHSAGLHLLEQHAS